MRRSVTLIPLALVLLAARPALCQNPPPSPKLTEVDPGTGKSGAEFTTKGENLGKNMVAELYFTDGKNDIKLQIMQQEAAAIKFKAPDSVKPGRYSLMLLTADRARMLEQPVKVTIE